MGLVLRYIVEHASGRCDYRRYFPTALVPFVPGELKLVKRSLGKVDDPDFDRLHREAAREYERLAKMAQKARDKAYDALDAPTIAWLAETFVAEELEADEEARWDTEERELYRRTAKDLEQREAAATASWHPDDPLRWASKTREAASWSLDHRRGLRAAGDLEGIVRSLQVEAELLLEAHGFVIAPSDVHAMQNLCRALNDASIKAAEAKLDRLDGEEVLTPATPTRPVEVADKPHTAKTKVSLMETFEGYAAKPDMTPGVRDEWRRYVARLVEWLGHDDATRLTADDLLAWKNELLSETTRTGRLRDPVTVRDKYITSVKATLNWAVQERLAALPKAEGPLSRRPGGHECPILGWKADTWLEHLT